MKAAARSSTVPTLLTDEQIDEVAPDELRAAYRELATHHEEMRRKLKQNTADALQEMREQGKATGEPQYGFRAVNGKLKPRRDEQRVIARVRAMKSEGLTAYAIAKALNDAGVEPREGKRFWPIQILRIIGADERDRTDPADENTEVDSVHSPKDLADLRQP